MNTPLKSDLGFGKKVRAVWLDLALKMVANGRTFEDAREELSDLIRKDNPGLEAIQKVLTGLNRVWFNPPGYCRTTRNTAVEFYRHSQHSERLLFHWGMSISAYPFIGAVAEAIGRLLRLQGVATIQDVKRRVGERFGDREFVQRIVRYNLSSFVDWGVLSSSDRKGEYKASASIPVSRPIYVGWLIESLLHSREESVLSVGKMRQHPMMFPFSVLDCSSGLISTANPRIQVIRHSHNEELVTLRGE